MFASSPSRVIFIEIKATKPKIVINPQHNAAFSQPYENGNGAPERIRTSDPLIRSQVLYPAELRVHRGRV
jgi:hypothetical protein